MNVDFARHVLQVGIGIWLQSTWLVLLGLTFGRIVRKRGPLAAAAAYRGTLVSVAVSAALGICLAGQIRPLVTIDLPSTPAVERAPSARATMPETSFNVEKLHTSVNFPSTPVPAPSTSLVSTSVQARPAGLHVPLYSIAVGLWAVVALAQLLWLIACHVWLWSLRRRSKAVMGGMCYEILWATASRLGVRAPSLVISTRVGSPFVAGVFRPCIYLPERFTLRADADEESAVFAHELAHVRGHDCAWNIAFRLSTALLWTQPLLWLLRREWQQASEEVCDQWVLACDCAPDMYARCLLTLAESSMSGRPERVAGVGVFSFKSLLGRRIERILERTQARLLNLSPRARAGLMTATVAAAVAAVFLVSTPARSMVRAQIHRLAAAPVVVAGHPADYSVRTTKRSHASMRSKPSSVIPALLALAGGAVQVNLPADAVAKPVVKPAAVVKSTTPDTATTQSTDASTASKSNDVIIQAQGNVRVHMLPVNADAPVSGPAPTAPTAAAANDVRITADRNCSLDFENVPVDVAIRKFFKVCGANFSIASDVHGSVNIRMENVDMLTALRAILHASDVPLTYDFTDGVYNVRVKRIDASANVAPDVPSSSDQSFKATPETQNWGLQVQHISAAVAVDMINKAHSSGVIPAPNGLKITDDPARNTISLTCDPGTDMDVQAYLKKIDVSPQSVWVGIKVVQTSGSELHRLGIDASTLADAVPVDAETKLKDALKRGKLRVTDSPTMTTTSGFTSSIATHAGAVGITISIGDNVTADSSIQSSIHVEQTYSDGSRAFDANKLVHSGDTSLVAAIAKDSGGRRHDPQIQLVFVSSTLLDDHGNPVVADASR